MGIWIEASQRAASHPDLHYLTRMEKDGVSPGRHCSAVRNRRGPVPLVMTGSCAPKSLAAVAVNALDRRFYW